MTREFMHKESLWQGIRVGCRLPKMYLVWWFAIFSLTYKGVHGGHQGNSLHYSSYGWVDSWYPGRHRGDRGFLRTKEPAYNPDTNHRQLWPQTMSRQPVTFNFPLASQYYTTVLLIQIFGPFLYLSVTTLHSVPLLERSLHYTYDQW